MKKLIVETKQGKLEGLHGWDPRIAVFKGVPYAKPPVGKLRFRSPQPLEKWDGVRTAYDYAPVSMQQLTSCPYRKMQTLTESELLASAAGEEWLCKRRASTQGSRPR